MDNFQVSVTKPILEVINPISIHAKENCDNIWQMFFDCACSKEGNGARVIFISPSCKIFKYSFLLNFECTNNIAEYEALIIGLDIAKVYGIKLLTVLGDSDLIVSQIRHKFSTRKPRLKQYRNYVWDLIEYFDAFSIKWTDRPNNYLANIMANLAVRQIDLPFNEVIQVQMKYRPSIPDNVQNWQVFEDDKDLIRFLTCEEDYENQIIDWNGCVEENDGKETLFGKEIVQLKMKKIPKGLVALERIFDERESARHSKSIKIQNNIEEINLGNENSPKNVYIGKKLSSKIRAELISLLRKYRHVFAWSYNELQAYREDLFQHEMPLKPNAKPFRQRQRPINPTLAPKMKDGLIKLRDVKIIKPIRHSTWVSNLVPVRKKNGDIRLCVDFRNLNISSLKDN